MAVQTKAVDFMYVAISQLTANLRHPVIITAGKGESGLTPPNILLSRGNI